MDVHTGLNVVDYTILGILVLSGLLALMRGFVREVLSLLSWAGAYFAAAQLYPLAEPLTRKFMHGQTGTTAAAAVIVFVVALIVLTIVSMLIARFIRGRTLTAIDRSLGFIFGLLRGALVVSLLYFVAVSVLWPEMDHPKHVETANLDAPPKIKDVKAEDKTEEEGDKEKDRLPSWLLKAKTRPALVYGATILKSLITKEDVNQTKKQYKHEKNRAEHLLEEEAPATVGHKVNP